MTLETIIGLEIHVQLKTKTKMFCSCDNHSENVAPNTNICPVCLGHPGTLPVTNEQSVRWAVLAGLAINSKINETTKFDRKNYFYPDLPKGYQISQYDIPVAEGGYLDLHLNKGPRRDIRIGITRLHLEEDAAKNIHIDGKTLVDFNRAGTPLIEIVSEPDFRTPAEAKEFLQELRLIMRYLDVSNADMEKGHLRCDANISLRKLDDDGNVVGEMFNPKTEIKNLNSFRAVERALQHEIERQTDLWSTNSPPSVQSTRGWNADKQITEEQRTKEDEKDYRYFPEPDLPPIDLAATIEEQRNKIPELPQARRLRFTEEYGFSIADSKIITDDPRFADYTEAVVSEVKSWLLTLPEVEGDSNAVWENNKKALSKLVASWLISKMGGLMSERGINIRTTKVTPEDFAEFISLLYTSKITGQTGLTILTEMLETGADPTHVMEDKQLGRMDNESEIEQVIDRIIANNPNEVERFRAGKVELIKFFLGMIMKETQGNADAKIAQKILKQKLK